MGTTLTAVPSFTSILENADRDQWLEMYIQATMRFNFRWIYSISHSRTQVLRASVLFNPTLHYIQL